MNTDQEPWAPDPDVAPGTPPVSGTGGERGTSVFDGNTNYNADYTSKTANAAGPGTGASYHSTESPVTSAYAVPRAREVAGTHALLTPTNVLTASSLAPVNATSVTLTATLASVADWLVSGTVTFKEGATVLGTGVLNGSEVATLVLAGGFTAGAHVVTAVYPGDTNFAAVTSAGITITAS